MDTFDRESGRDLPSLPGRAAQPIPQRRTAAMKVAMICDVMGQPNNGTTLAALNLIRYLRDAGHTVTVVACFTISFSSSTLREQTPTFLSPTAPEY